ncbi:hypothetical protein [Streptomyces collinus]
MTELPGLSERRPGPGLTSTGVEPFASATHFPFDGDIHGGARLERRADIG